MQYIHSFEHIVPNFHRKSFNVPLFPGLLENFFQLTVDKIFTFSLVFIKNLSLNLIWLILTYKEKLNCRDLQRITVMTLLSY